MSVVTIMEYFAGAEEYDHSVAEFIALEVARGIGLSELHEIYPDRVPNPLIVKRWAARNLNFKALMREAEETRAEKLADETITLADSKDILAADKAQRLKARHWLAGKLDERYSGGIRGEKGKVDLHVGVILTDDQLMAIAAQAALPAPGVIEGESRRVVVPKDAVVSEGVVRDTVGEAEGVSEDEAVVDEPDPDPCEF